MTEEYLTLAEAAQRMNLSTVRVSQLIQSGELEAEIFPNSRPKYFIPLDAITKLMTKRATSNRTKSSYKPSSKTYKVPMSVTNREAEIIRLREELRDISQILNYISKNPDLIDLILDLRDES